MGFSRTCSNVVRVLRPFISRDLLIVAAVVIILYLHTRMVRIQTDSVITTVQDYVVTSMGHVQEEVNRMRSSQQQEQQQNIKRQQGTLQHPGRSEKHPSGQQQQSHGGVGKKREEEEDEDEDVDERISNEIRMMFHRLEAEGEGQEDDEDDEEEKYEEVQQQCNIEEVVDTNTETQTDAQQNQTDGEQQPAYSQEQQQQEPSKEPVQEEPAKEQPEEEVNPDAEHEQELNKMKYHELKKMAHSMGVDSKGTKEVLIGNILSAKQ